VLDIALLLSAFGVATLVATAALSVSLLSLVVALLLLHRRRARVIDERLVAMGFSEVKAGWLGWIAGMPVQASPIGRGRWLFRFPTRAQVPLHLEPRGRGATIHDLCPPLGQAWWDGDSGAAARRALAHGARFVEGRWVLVGPPADLAGALGAMAEATRAFDVGPTAPVRRSEAPAPDTSPTVSFEDDLAFGSGLAARFGTPAPAPKRRQQALRVVTR
jgi:hypothetical protein